LCFFITGMLGAGEPLQPHGAQAFSKVVAEDVFPHEDRALHLAAQS